MVPIGSMSMQVMIFVNTLAPLFFYHSLRDMTCAENFKLLMTSERVQYWQEVCGQTGLRQIHHYCIP